MFQILGFFWFVRTVKAILFWLYLWQLKEYHIGRFLAHFQTAKGRQLLFNKIIILKVVLALIFLFGFFLFSFEILPPSIFAPAIYLCLFQFFIWIPFLILLLYIFEAVHAFFVFLQKRLKKPITTKKTILLVSLSLVLEALFIITIALYVRDAFGEINFILATFYFLLFDIFTPLIISAVVLLLQPLTILQRNRLIKKAKKKRESFKNLLVIGVTGSYGKTSVKEFLYTILSEKFYPVKSDQVGIPPKAELFNRVNILKTEKHQNSEVGISQCILNNLKPEHKIFICEMGAYNRGGIKLLCDIAKPKIGILAGINQQHLATFGSQENTIKAKYELIESLPDNGLAIFNGNNKFCQELYQKTIIPKKIYHNTFSTAVEKVLSWDLEAREVVVKKEFVSFKVFSKARDSADFKVSLLGKQSIENVLAACCCAKELGMNLGEISQACQKIKPMPGSGRLVKSKSGLNVIDAVYSSNPDGIIAHLEHLKFWQGKKAIVMPCLIELGSASKEVHQKIGKKIGEVCDLAIITTKECFQNVKKSALKSGMKQENILFIENPERIFESIKSFTNTDDIVLLESRVPQELIDLLFGVK